MSNNTISSLSSPAAWGHITFFTSVAVGALTAALFFTLNLDKLPTALMCGTGGGFFILSIALYGCACYCSRKQLASSKKPFTWQRPEGAGDSRIYKQNEK